MITSNLTIFDTLEFEIIFETFPLSETQKTDIFIIWLLKRNVKQESKSSTILQKLNGRFLSCDIFILVFEKAIQAEPNT